MDIFAMREVARVNDLANRTIAVDPPGSDIVDHRCLRWDQCSEGFGHRGKCKQMPASDTEPGILERLRRYSS